jgi:hypothetical protein
MNKTLKSILIGLGIVVAILVIIMVSFGIKMKSEMKNVTETKEVVQNI